MRDYLLGQATDAEVERLENRLLEDEDVYATLRGVEDDLFDDYARGALTLTERQRFAERYGADRGRLLVAGALTRRTLPLRPSRPLRSSYVAAAAAALVVAGGIGLTIWMRERTGDQLSSAVRAPSAHPLQATAVLLITLGSSRSQTETPEVALPADAPTLELRVTLNPADRFDVYSMELRSESGVLVWRADGLHALEERGNLVVVGAVPAATLTESSYELSVRGSMRGAPEEALGFAPLSIRR
jgi:hypothetical protein